MVGIQEYVIYYGDYVGITVPYSLLTTSEVKELKGCSETWGRET